ncbi:MAG TPA: copper resistance protein CopC, partial [Candidatus Limnocylindria bacterium]|nr:copper resistance protein CopC [Candidatus Limnocylindria bacterium]
MPASVYSLGSRTSEALSITPPSPRCVGGLLAALLLAALVLPAAASAHAELIGSDPEANASLLESPTDLTLTFSEAIDEASATVTLLTPEQVVIPGVGPLTVDRAGTVATVPLPTLTPGVYTVDYQVTSAVDGHVTSGIFAFLVDPSGTQAPPTSESSQTSLSTGLDVVLARWLALAAALALVGIVVFWLFSARPALAHSGVSEVAAPWGPISIAAAATLLGLVLYLTLAAQPIIESGGHLGHGDSFPLDFAAPFGWTPFAIAMRVAMLGAFAAFALAVSHWIAHDEARRRSTPAPLSADRGWLSVMLAAGLLTLGGMSFAGHAAANGPLTAAIDLLHLVAAACWIGTLAGLALLVFRRREVVAEALRHHSRIALAAAPIVVLSGLINSPLLVGDARELVASGYGNTVLLKVLLFSGAVGLGSANFFLVRAGSVRRSLPLIGVELVLGAAAVLAAANLVSGQPSGTRRPELVQPPLTTAHLYGEAGASSVHVAVNLPVPGNQGYQVGIARRDNGAPRDDVQRVFLEFTPPEGSDLAPERVQLEQGASDSVWSTQGAYTPVVGEWGLEVIVRRVGELDESAHFPLTVSEPQPPQTVPPPDIGVGVPRLLTAAWVLVPDGVGGWLVVLILLAGGIGVGLLARSRPSAWLSVARAALVLATVGIGLVVG